jgi:hypothetical protein
MTRSVQSWKSTLGLWLLALDDEARDLYMTPCATVQQKQRQHSNCEYA